MTDEDRIERRIVLHAPLDRVWDAIGDSRRFGAWFGAELDGPFEAGATVTGRIVPTAVDAAAAAQQEPHRGAPLALRVLAIEPPHRLVFRWEPVPGAAPTTVTFRVAETPDGVEVVVSEEGFAALPADVRDTTREGNAGGWEAQTGLLARYLESA